MTAVITGDIIKSRKTRTPDIWIPQLKSVLQYLNSEQKYWELFRGDSFQIELPDYKNSFIGAVYIKASIKMLKGLDVRMAIGIGSKKYQAKTIGESNGEAFIFSGEIFETLKAQKQNLKIKTKNTELNREMNLYFALALIGMDKWTVNTAEIVKLTIENPKLVQQELGKIIDLNQSTVSRRQKRAHLEELFELHELFKQKITSL